MNPNNPVSPVLDNNHQPHADLDLDANVADQYDQASQPTAYSSPEFTVVDNTQPISSVEPAFTPEASVSPTQTVPEQIITQPEAVALEVPEFGTTEPNLVQTSPDFGQTTTEEPAPTPVAPIMPQDEAQSTAETMPNTAAAKPSTKSSPVWMIVSFFLLAVIAAMLAYYFLAIAPNLAS